MNTHEHMPIVLMAINGLHPNYYFPSLVFEFH